MSTYPFKCDLCGGLTDAPTYGDFKCQHCGQAYVYDECHRVELSERQLQTLRGSRWIPVSERLPEPSSSEYEDGVRVLAWSQGNGIDPAWFYRDSESGDRWSWDSTTEPTHWMPLPEPPTQ